MGRELTDKALTDEMLAFFGVKRTTSLLGWAFVFAAAGAKGAVACRAVRFGSLPARYKAVTDLIRFRDYLEAAGYELQTEIEVRTPEGVLGALA